ncbi:MAG: hypothetical protein MJ153_00400 [Clostridia bacterium]|nr:hypothetical protein [Clostridia bacterium]
MNGKNIVALLITACLIGGCSAPVDQKTVDTSVTDETESSIEVIVTDTFPEENQEALRHIDNSYELMTADNVSEALEEAMLGYETALYPDDTDLPFVLSELLGAYDVGNTYRATDSFDTECDISEDTVLMSYPGSRYIALKNNENVTVIDTETHMTLYDIQINSGDNKCAFVNENLFCYCGPDSEGMYGEFAMDLASGRCMQFGLGYEADSVVLADGEGRGMFLYYNNGGVLHLIPTEENPFEMETQDYQELNNCEPGNILFENDTAIVGKDDVIYGVNLNEGRRVISKKVNGAILFDAASMGDKFLLSYGFEDEEGNITNSQIDIFDGENTVTVSSEELTAPEIIVMPNNEENFYLFSGNSVIEVEAESASVSNRMEFDNNIVSVYTADGNINVILDDGSVHEAYRCIGLTSNYVCRADDILSVTECGSGFVMLPRDGNRVIVFTAIDSQMSVTVTATDSDSMRPQTMECDGDYSLFADFKLALNDEGAAVIYSGNDEVGRFELVDGKLPSSSVCYGGYNILYDSGSQIGYILKGPQLIGIAHNFVALDPSDLSVYIGTDVMHKIFIMDCEDLTALLET